ncbi:MAG TPA: DNA polymerase, partial [Candidatus Limnocylindrales bacterium]|nr:DNA polymerase [Candidatus Limnocylindrales bacterium]
MDRLMLLDGFGLVYRGYYALPPLTTSKGELVNGVFGFCSIVLRGIADLRPDYLAVAFDLSGPTFRHEQYAEYKATRTRMPDDLAAQFPKVREVVKALRIPVYEQAGYEADDAIGTLVGQAEAADVETTIVSVDLDMLQLVSDRTRLMTTRSGVENTVIYDPARIWERFGLRPDQMIDYKALKGDPTDNIAGVPGVGEKTAAKLVAEFGHLEGLYDRLAEVKPEKLRDKLAEHRDQVFQGRELSRIVRDLPLSLDLPAARLGDYDRDTVLRLFREYEFRTLIERLPAMTGESPTDKAQALRAVATSGEIPAAKVGTERPAGWGEGRPIRAGSLGGDGLQLTLDFDHVGRGSAVGTGAARGSLAPAGPREPQRFDDLPSALGATIADPGRIELVGATDVPALGDWLAGHAAVGAAIVFDDPRPRRGQALAFGLAASDGRVVVGDGSEAAAALRRLVESRDLPLVAHEAKPILVARFGAEPSAPATPVEFDTQIAAYILNAALRSQTIADVVAERLNLVLPPPKELAPVHRAGLEALSALAAREPLARALTESGLERLFREIELPLLPVLARMEARGVAVDLAALAELDREFGMEIARLEQEIYAAVGHEFTIGSPKQLGDILFGELRLPKGRKTKTGYSTDAAVLEELVGVHPVVQPVLDWRIYTKLRSTYVEALPTLLGPDGRLHTLFHQAVAATGRLSSSDPNLQ